MGDKGENQELYTSSFSRPICLETTVVPTRSPTLLARVAKGSMVGQMAARMGIRTRPSSPIRVEIMMVDITMPAPLTPAAPMERIRARKMNSKRLAAVIGRPNR